MKHVVIGTAGHVDHGKTWLTRALTGINTDRLEEEQRRGITLDLGFAQMKLPNGQSASVVDMPGHEKFVRNMIVGATGIDVVLLIVAADEGFMPQTQEHLDILQLLDVKSGIIVLTKKDLVDEDWLSVVSEDTRERVKGTFLENAPIIAVSASTGEGIEELKQEIVKMVEHADVKRVDIPFRLPVDRVFTKKGFGTIVTGTLVDGTLRMGDVADIYPQEITAKVRGLQTHNIAQPEVFAGMRVAVNLTGVDTLIIRRGCTVAAPQSMIQADKIAVRLNLLPDSQYDVRNSSQLHFYHGTQELMAKVRLLDRDVLEAGESCFAQLTLNKELTMRNQDKFIVRFFSPVITVGGGEILAPTSRKLKRNDQRVLAHLAHLAWAPEDRARQIVLDSGIHPLTVAEVASLAGMAESNVAETLEKFVGEGNIVKIGAGYVALEALKDLAGSTSKLVGNYHRTHTLDDGMSLSELRQRIYPASASVANALIEWLCDNNVIESQGGIVRLPGFEPSCTDLQRQMLDNLNAFYEKVGLEPPTNDEVQQQFQDKHGTFNEVFSHMIKKGTLVGLSNTTSVHRTAYATALSTFMGMFAESNTVAIGEYRTKLGVSRKYAQLYLEYFDACHISKMVDGVRVLVKPNFG
ncbi:MAG: selenocysteine-specific translation elongation factor [Atopobiaceae bacterium]|jgi:selenocysteine-specific elongation factor